MTPYSWACAASERTAAAMRVNHFFISSKIHIFSYLCADIERTLMNRSLSRTLLSLIPVLVLVALLALNISIFGSDAILGASQVALLAAAGV